MLNFDIEEVNPMLAAANCKLPVTFIHGMEDRLIDVSHSKSLLNTLQSQEKVLVEI